MAIKSRKQATLDKKVVAFFPPILLLSHANELQSAKKEMQPASARAITMAKRRENVNTN